jgi:uncharacterized membrane protein YbaN (DUF454 family)
LTQTSSHLLGGLQLVLGIVLIMVGILLVAGFVVVYAAFPHRGEDIPGAPWLSDMMNRATDAVPTLEEEEAEQSNRVFG